MRMRCPSPLIFFNNIPSFTPVGPPPPPLRKLNKVPNGASGENGGRVDIKTQFAVDVFVCWLEDELSCFLSGQGFLLVGDVVDFPSRYDQKPQQLTRI